MHYFMSSVPTVGHVVSNSTHMAFNVDEGNQNYPSCSKKGEIWHRVNAPISLNTY